MSKNSKMKKQMQRISDWARKRELPLMHAIFWRQRAGFYIAGTLEHP